MLALAPPGFTYYSRFAELPARFIFELFGVVGDNGDIALVSAEILLFLSDDI